MIIKKRIQAVTKAKTPRALKLRTKAPKLLIINSRR